MLQNNIDTKRLAVIMIYIVTFIFFISKVEFYEQYVGRFPDESAHISYIAYLDVEDKVIPDFFDIPVNVAYIEDSVNQYTFSMVGTNYLGHPPLYYNIVNLFNEITIDGDSLSINVDNLRLTSQIITYIGLILAFGLGFYKIKKLHLHFLYATIITSIPMFAYTTAGVNNDSLSFTGFVIFLIAIVGLLEKRSSYFWYFLLAASIFIVLLNKVTLAIIVVLICLAVIIYIIAKEKSIKIIVNKYFFVTLPIYALIIVYYLFTLNKYGTFQPSLAMLDYDYFITTGFYVPTNERVSMTFIEYLCYYIPKFLGTWTGIASHVALMKPGGYLNIHVFALNAVLILPALSLISKKRNTLSIVGSITYIATFITAIFQFFNAYNAFSNIAGYLGGYQSRYYLCVLPALAFTICIALEDRYEYFKEKDIFAKKFIVCFSIGLSLLLIYEDFIYFTLNFNSYL